MTLIDTANIIGSTKQYYFESSFSPHCTQYEINYSVFPFSWWIDFSIFRGQLEQTGPGVRIQSPSIIFFSIFQIIIFLFQNFFTMQIYVEDRNTFHFDLDDLRLTWRACGGGPRSPCASGWAGGPLRLHWLGPGLPRLPRRASRRRNWRPPRPTSTLILDRNPVWHLKLNKFLNIYYDNRSITNLTSVESNI